MGNTSPVSELEDFSNSIKDLEHKIRSIEDEVRCTACKAEFCSRYTTETIELLDKMDKYMYEAERMCNYLDEFADKLRHISESYCNASSPLFDFIVNIDVGTWWKQAYPIIEQIATLTGAITGIAAVTTAPLVFIKWIRNKLQERKNKDEYTWVKLILNEEEWAISTLSDELDLTEDDAKKMLKGFGYKWNPQKMLYVSTENTQKLRDIDIHKRD